ncbi:MAG: hypothetical protein WCV93_01980 [Candidatus Shapirobacteria bacterium]|jgi:hypothetical protein
MGNTDRVGVGDVQRFLVSPSTQGELDAMATAAYVAPPREGISMMDQESPLKPPLRFQADGRGDWVLVSRSLTVQDSVLLAKFDDDGEIYYRLASGTKFRQENNISDNAIRGRMNSRYQIDSAGGEVSNWTYGGVFNNKVVLFCADISRPVEERVTSRTMTIGDFLALKEAQRKGGVIEGSVKPGVVINEAVVRPQLDFYRPNGSPAVGNLFRCEKALLLPDNHGGLPGSPFGRMLDGATGGELVMVQEVPDRGAEIARAMQETMEMVKSGRAVYLIGNHDPMMMMAMSGDEKALFNWLHPKYGHGDATIRSCGYNLPVGFGDDFEEFQKTIVQISSELKTDPRFQILREWVKFVEDYGRVFVNINGHFAVHAGLPVDKAGNLVEMTKLKKDSCFKGKVGVALLLEMQIALRKKDMVAIGEMYGASADDGGLNPLWIREPWFAVAENPGLVHKVREQLNEQMAQRYPNDPRALVEVVVLGHSPWRGDERWKSHSICPRLVFIDVGFADDGHERVLKLEVNPSSPSTVSATYSDPSGRDPVMMVANYDLH